MVGRVFLGRYEAQRLLAEGGMGKVYLARQLDLGRQVVVKVMHEDVAQDPKFRERFQRETLLMARFQHPYAVTLYDASLEEQHACIVMEYIKGVTLDVLRQRNDGRMSPTRVGRLLGQLCEVLQAAHSQGILHRDLKPTNLMIVDPDSPYEKLKVMDFGLAKLRRRADSQNPSGSEGEFAIGTPAYICPEQVRGEDADHRGDIYSVGVILFELLTGQVPFAGRSTMDMLLAQATEQPPTFEQSGVSVHIPKAIERVVVRCLAKEPEQRPASARELAEMYESALTERPEGPDDGVRSLPETDSEPVDLDPAQLRPHDPHAIVRQLEAWMPEAVASHKLRGFVQDAGGEVMESVPGLIRVRLGRPGTPYATNGGAFSWLGLGRNSGVEMALKLHSRGRDRGNLLRITVSMKSLKGASPADPVWRARCDQIYCDLRAYLMAQDSCVEETVG
jgi:serine/threonine-protein kinase